MQVKGTAVVTVPLFVKAKYGEEGFQKWLSPLSQEAQDVYRFPILSSSWYPVKEILVDPVQKVCDLFYGGSAKGAWESGRFSAEYGLKGIYKIFVRIGSVQFLVNKATTILPTYYDTCSLKVVTFEDKQSILHITEFPGADVLLEHRIGGWIEKALEISGCKDVQVTTTKSLARKDPVTEFKMKWS